MESNILNKDFKKEESIVSRRICNDIVLVPIRHNLGDVDHIYTLNEVGARIWDLMDQIHHLDTIKDKLLAEYDAGVSQVENDLIAFIKDLKEINAITEIAQDKGE